LALRAFRTPSVLQTAIQRTHLTRQLLGQIRFKGKALANGLVTFPPSGNSSAEPDRPPNPTFAGNQLI
jgi:hypothetical protein